MPYKHDWVSDSGRVKKKSFLAAAAVHGLLIAGLFFSPWSRPAVLAHDVFAVQLVDMPQVSQQQETVARVTEEPRVLPEQVPPVPDRPPAQVRETPRPAVREETRRPERPAFSESQFREQLASRVSEVERTEPAHELSPVETSMVNFDRPETAYVDVTGFRMDSEIPQWYLLRVKEIIQANWSVDVFLQHRSAAVSFRVSSAGSISGVSLEKSSGNARFDRSAVDAVSGAGGLPPFPAEIRQPHIDIVIDFKTEN